MFKQWDFLLAEIWVLLALAALIGLFAGWIIWGGRRQPHFDDGEITRLRAELDREKARGRVQSSDPLDDIPAMQGGGYSRPTQMPARPPAIQPTAAPKPAPMPAPPPPPPEDQISAPPPSDPTPTEPVARDVGAKPAGLAEARDGLPDDLTKISGVGPKMEKLCNRLGFWHYDQIAGWSDAEIAWVDDNLEGFKGRVTRDQWVQQAKALAQNETPAFVRRED